jgi:subtilisin-like proprotein convertase family protein
LKITLHADPRQHSVGIERALATTEAGQVSSVEVTLDISHTYIGDLRVRLRAPNGAEAVLHDRAGGSGDNIARTCTAANTPSLAGLAGQAIAGAWKLLVSDHEAIDVGKLNKWTLTLRRVQAAINLAAGR